MKSNILPEIEDNNSLSYRGPRKLLFVYKLDKEKNKDVMKQANELFDNPDTYLQLPQKMKYNYCIGKKMKESSSEYCNNFITLPNFMRKQTITTIPTKRGPSPNTSRTNNSVEFSSTIHSKTVHKFNIYKSPIKRIGDKEIKEIFKECKTIIRDNRLHTQNEYLKSIPNDFKKELIKQEKILKLNESVKKEHEDISNKIKERIRNREIKLRVKKRNRNENYDKLLMESTDSSLVKNKAYNYLEKSKGYTLDHNLINGNKWLISLRRPPNFNGSRDIVVPYGTKNNQKWAKLKEHSPFVNETVADPKWDEKSFFLKKEFFKKRISEVSDDEENTRISHSYDCATKLLKYQNKAKNLVNLEINGKNLLKFEENNFHSMIGNKKLVFSRNIIENANTQDLLIAKSYKNIKG